MKKELVDFNKYTNPEDVKDYELFIGPYGEYYKVKTRYESCDNCTHYEWALHFLEDHAPNILKKEEIKKYCKTPLEVLINIFGYIRYTHFTSSRPFFDIPSTTFGYKMSKEQINSLFNIMDYNHEKITPEMIEKIYGENRNYEERIDKVFERIIGK